MEVRVKDLLEVVDLLVVEDLAVVKAIRDVTALLAHKATLDLQDQSG
jgi:hypothetical protein